MRIVRSLIAAAVWMLSCSTATRGDPLRYEPSDDPSVGFVLTTFGNPSSAAWELAVQSLFENGVRDVSFVTYRFVSGTAINSTSGFGHARPADAGLRAGMVRAKSLGMHVTLNPFIQLDEAGGIGATWRGTLNFSGQNLAAFFTSYQQYILEMADLADEVEADRLMVGSELELLSRNSAATPLWNGLIAATRGHFTGALSYAANWDQYERVPFWSALDEIGIDAYFPIATQAAAAGPGNPSVETLVAGWAPVLSKIESFARPRGLPVHFSETGTVPRDTTTVRPWLTSPSSVSDPQEQENAYRAIVAATDRSEWLTNITFWHWDMTGASGSPFRIRPDSLPAEFLSGYLATVAGDMNGDGLLDNLDLAPFALALVDPGEYLRQFPRLSADSLGDVNHDERFDNLDIAAFAALISAPPAIVPEGNSGVLLMLGLAGMCVGRRANLWLNRRSAIPPSRPDP